MKTRHVFEEHLYFDRLVGLLQGESKLYIYILRLTEFNKVLNNVRFRLNIDVVVNFLSS